MVVIDDESRSGNCFDQLFGGSVFSIQGLAGKSVTSMCPVVTQTLPSIELVTDKTALLDPSCDGCTSSLFYCCTSITGYWF